MGPYPKPEEAAMRVTLLMAMTLDGRIGRSPDHFPDWTGSADKRLFAARSREAGVMIMGSKTFDTIGRPLPGRKTVVMTRDPNRISKWDNLVFTSRPPAEILSGLEAEGYTEAILAGGAMVNSRFAEDGLIDTLVVTISPKIFGYGLSLFTEEISMELSLESVERMEGGLVCLTYRVEK